jgi:hypothetical protein
VRLLGEGLAEFLYLHRKKLLLICATLLGLSLLAFQIGLGVFVAGLLAPFWAISGIWYVTLMRVNADEYDEPEPSYISSELGRSLVLLVFGVFWLMMFVGSIYSLTS